MLPLQSAFVAIWQPCTTLLLFCTAAQCYALQVVQAHPKAAAGGDAGSWCYSDTGGAAKPAFGAWNGAHAHHIITHTMDHDTGHSLQHSNPVRNTLLVLTGEEEDLDLGKMVREGEVAWLHKADMPGSGPGRAEHAGELQQQAWHAQRQGPHSPDQAAARKRKDPPAGRHTHPATRPASAHQGRFTATVLTAQHGVRCMITHSRMFCTDSPSCLGCTACMCYLVVELFSCGLLLFLLLHSCPAFLTGFNYGLQHLYHRLPIFDSCHGIYSHPVGLYK